MKPIVIDLSQAVGVNTVPLNIKDKTRAVRAFAVPERSDDARARMAHALQSAKSDDAVREVAADWLLACSTDGITRAEALALLTPSGLPQILTVLLTGKLPDLKKMDRLLTRLSDRMLDSLIDKL